MSDRSRFVFDTGVLIGAAIFPRSVPSLALDIALNRGDLIVSKSTIDEVAKVIRRPKFDRYLSKPVRDAFLAKLVLKSLQIEISEPITASRDPKDDMFLELAIAGQASCIVSGDADLLVLNPFRSIPILSPREFLDKMW